MAAPDPLVLVTGAAGFIGRALAPIRPADRHLGPEGLLLSDLVIDGPGSLAGDVADSSH